MAHRANRGEAGSTLIEVLVAIVIMSVSATAILGLFVTSISGSAEHRSISATNTLLEDYAESIKYQVELQPTPLFAECPTPSVSPSTQHYLLNHYEGDIDYSIPSAYSGKYSVAIQSVEPWNASTDAFDQNGCPTSGANTDANGLQQLTLIATGPDAVSESLTLIVRNPAFNEVESNAAF